MIEWAFKLNLTMEYWIKYTKAQAKRQYFMMDQCIVYYRQDIQFIQIIVEVYIHNISHEIEHMIFKINSE
ncbi:unnamed protein product [Schistosoma rodhaini]|nr:unnamed protein product [Schistosoma rodhaini]